MRIKIDFRRFAETPYSVRDDSRRSVIMCAILGNGTSDEMTNWTVAERDDQWTALLATRSLIGVKTR